MDISIPPFLLGGGKVTSLKTDKLRVYTAVFVGLNALLLLTIAVARFDLGRLNLIVAMASAGFTTPSACRAWGRNFDAFYFMSSDNE